MTILIDLLGAFAALFALALLALPAWRVLQRRLPVHHAVGLWIAGAGFATLAAAALVVEEQTTPALILGVALTVTGNIVQRRNTRDSPP